MREIKFRAWDNDAEIMIYSDYDSIDTDDYWWGFNPIRCGCITGERGGGNYSEPPEPIVTYYEDIMQFTGLKAHLGKEISESDLWSDGLCGVLYVVQFTNNFIFELVPINIPVSSHNVRPIICADKEGYIKGNLYENPELLK